MDVLEAGATDAMCCPGDLVTRVWVLMPGGLVEVRATPTGRLALSALSPPAATLLACPDPAGAVEQRFLAQLASVKRYSFVAGMLSLEYDANGSGDAMLFKRRGVPEPLSSE